LALAQLNAVVNDFQANGIMECVDNSYHGVPDYVDSGTNVLLAAIALQSQ